MHERDSVIIVLEGMVAFAVWMPMTKTTGGKNAVSVTTHR
jgi:hypothetical protein